MPVRITSIVGARPQFVKVAVVDAALRDRQAEHTLIHTGQHYDEGMSAVFFRDLDLAEPRHDLGVGSGPHGAQTAAMLARLEALLVEDRPDWVVVYGDTNSTLAGALAAAKLHVPVAHVESGLRSYNRRMPEEINRILTDHAADLLFAPTQGAVDTLRLEGVPAERIELVGDVMYDATLRHARRASGTALDRLGLEHGGFVLATVHRAENTDDPARLSAIFGGLEAISADIEVVVPLHPRTAAALGRAGSGGRRGPLRLIDPVGYLEMLELEGAARLVATDSGGVQKEAFFQRVPCVTLRDETEWTELVDLGWNELVPPRSEAAVAEGLRAALARGLPAEPQREPYGGGRAGERIATRLTA